MTEYQIRYMVDPGDGIVSVTIHEDENDDMVGALCNWLLEQPGDGPFVVGCEIVGHSLMDPHPDDLAVDRFAAAMKAKLKKKRQEGRGGWQSMTSEQLSALLHEHVRKGDPVDVANLAMMLHQNGQVIEPPATVVTDEPVGVEAIREAFDEISGLCRHLRQGGPAPEDLQDLSDALDEAVGIAANMLHALSQQPAAPVKRKRRYAQGTALGEFGILPMCDQVDDETVKVPSYDLAHEIWAAAQTAPGEGIEDAVERVAALLALPTQFYANDQHVQSIARGAKDCWIKGATIELPGSFLDGVVLGWDGGKVVNCPPAFVSDVGHKLAKDCGAYGLMWHTVDGVEARCSLRSDGDYDVSAIAKQFGGGGHKNAAGFSVPLQTLLSWYKRTESD